MKYTEKSHLQEYIPQYFLTRWRRPRVWDPNWFYFSPLNKLFKVPAGFPAPRVFAPLNRGVFDHAGCRALARKARGP
jgi:hypothetical protein